MQMRTIRLNAASIMIYIAIESKAEISKGSLPILKRNDELAGSKSWQDEIQ